MTVPASDMAVPGAVALLLPLLGAAAAGCGYQVGPGGLGRAATGEGLGETGGALGEAGGTPERPGGTGTGGAGRHWGHWDGLEEPGETGSMRKRGLGEIVVGKLGTQEGLGGNWEELGQGETGLRELGYWERLKGGGETWMGQLGWDWANWKRSDVGSSDGLGEGNWDNLGLRNGKELGFVMGWDWEHCGEAGMGVLGVEEEGLGYWGACRGLGHGWTVTVMCPSWAVTGGNNNT